MPGDSLLVRPSALRALGLPVRNGRAALQTLDVTGISFSGRHLREPLDPSAASADEVLRRSVQPVQVKERHPRRVELPVALKKACVLAVGAVKRQA